MNNREFYRSSSGDTWELVREDEHVFVLHTPNLASGGKATRIELAAFLTVESHAAQNVALVRMIGSLADAPAKAAA